LSSLELEASGIREWIGGPILRTEFGRLLRFAVTWETTKRLHLPQPTKSSASVQSLPRFAAGPFAAAVVPCREVRNLRYPAAETG
jgi:hypothetical protein